MNTIKVKKLDDLNLHLVELPRGTYTVNGKIFTAEDWKGTEIQIDDYETIKKLESKTIITKYKHIETDETISVEEYKKKDASLRVGEFIGGEDDFNGYFKYESLEIEFEHKKFCRDYTPVHKTITNEIDLVFETVNMVADTGIKFITPILDFTTGGSDENMKLYDYDRKSAVYTIIEDIFSELGYTEDKTDINYKATEEAKIWSKHRNLRYLVAFGTFIFNDTTVPSTRAYRGTLEDCVRLYEGDKKYIIDYITLRHNLFVRTPINEINVEKLYNQIGSLIKDIESFDYKVKDRDLYYDVVNKSKAIENTLVEAITKD